MRIRRLLLTIPGIVHKNIIKIDKALQQSPESQIVNNDNDVIFILHGK